MELIEEFASAASTATTASGSYFSCGVTEIFVESKAEVRVTSGRLGRMYTHMVWKVWKKRDQPEKGKGDL